MIKIKLGNPVLDERVKKIFFEKMMFFRNVTTVVLENLGGGWKPPSVTPGPFKNMNVKRLIINNTEGTNKNMAKILKFWFKTLGRRL